MKTDKVRFEVSFVPQKKWDNVDDSNYSGGLGEDAGRCDLSINTTDNQFWDVTLTDIYYKCNGTPAAATAGTKELQTTKCSATGNNYNSNSVLSESSSQNQWTSPFQDTDPDDLWCTQANTPTTYSPYQCNKIKCVMERLLDTKDTVYDWKFNTDPALGIDKSAGLLDNMLILNGRAQLWILGDIYTIALKAPSEYSTTIVADNTIPGKVGDNFYISIPIHTGAWSGIVLSLASLSLIGATLLV